MTVVFTVEPQPVFFVFVWPELQPSNNNTTKAMAACDSSSDDYHLSNAEWYWGNISRYLTRLYIDNSHDPELLGHPNMFVF